MASGFAPGATKIKLECKKCGDDILSGVYIIRHKDTGTIMGLRAFYCKCGKNLEVNE